MMNLQHFLMVIIVLGKNASIIIEASQGIYSSTSTFQIQFETGYLDPFDYKTFENSKENIFSTFVHR